MKLICPTCGWIQELDQVDLWLWFFSQNGSPSCKFFCKSGKCPENTELIEYKEPKKLNEFCGREECIVTNPATCIGCLGDEANDHNQGEE